MLLLNPFKYIAAELINRSSDANTTFAEKKNTKSNTQLIRYPKQIQLTLIYNSVYHILAFYIFVLASQIKQNFVSSSGALTSILFSHEYVSAQQTPGSVPDVN